MLQMKQVLGVAIRIEGCLFDGWSDAPVIELQYGIVWMFWHIDVLNEKIMVTLF